MNLKRCVAAVGAVLCLVMCCGSAFAGRDGVEPPEQMTLRLLIWDGYAPKTVRDTFVRHVRETYGVDLAFSITYASNPDDFFDALRNDKVDLISPAHNLPKDFRYNLTTNGLTLPIRLENIPNYTHLVPELYRQPWAMEGGEVYAVPVVQGPYALAYNTALVREEPTSWQVFWDPSWKRKFMVHKDYYELNVYISALALGHRSPDIFRFDAIKGRPLEEKIDYLAAESASFWQGFDKPENYRGLALSTTWRCMFPTADGAFDGWRIAVPQEGTPWWVDAMLVSHTLKEKPLLRRIAEAWINYLLTDEVQTRSIAMELGTYPVTRKGLSDYVASLPDTASGDTLRLLLKKRIPWQILEIRDRNAFKFLWSEAMKTRPSERAGEGR
ncbi:ABC transporter substrate-binding protein [Desulfoluna butyratoxydans]|uniref:Bacterial extracellular solute-binding protein n=1 Tax=Desulfoluna butyratoxydans TaxID=231438 RepID=A0A4V6ILH3_9BACT|nr:extracellular solute-binding protein [Desulfoluna butyratoxydans]VFQ45078.1 bacterial extracellular solute-binding protein [Desulfoluna butyratoxydans]